MSNGEKFVIIIPAAKTAKGATAAAPRIDVVLNWFEELKQRVKAP